MKRFIYNILFLALLASTITFQLKPCVFKIKFMLKYKDLQHVVAWASTRLAGLDLETLDDVQIDLNCRWKV